MTAVKAVVDRIEDNIVVLIQCDDKRIRMTLPLSLLSPGTGEGDILSVTLEREDATTVAARERLADRIGRLTRT